MTKPDGIELALFHALRYEEMTFKSSDTLKRWNIDKTEKEIILKWMSIRMNEIKDRIDG